MLHSFDQLQQTSHLPAVLSFLLGYVKLNAGIEAAMHGLTTNCYWATAFCWPAVFVIRYDLRAHSPQSCAQRIEWTSGGADTGHVKLVGVLLLKLRCHGNVC